MAVNKLVKQFNEVPKLYHYTSFESACKIIATKSLLFGKLDRMNDPMETQRAVFSNLDCEPIVWHKIQDGFRQISFSCDGKTEGFRISSMWGHYAECGTGVCLVLDKNALLSKCASKKMCHGKVHYVKDYYGHIIINTIEGIYANVRKLFFNKDKSWSPEQEYRVVSYRSDIARLDISGCLLGVILSGSRDYESRYNESDFKAMSAILGCSANSTLWFLDDFLGDWVLQTTGENPVTLASRTNLADYEIDV